jgi:hypothetical protein
MGQLESDDLLEPYDAIVLMGYTSNFGGSEQSLSNALAYCQAANHFPGIEACTGQYLPAGGAGVPWGMVIDLETMEVIAMENNDSYIDFWPATVYNAVKAAHDD